MDDQDEPTAWEEIGGRRESSALVARSLPVEARLADVHDLQPVDRAEFFSEISPCLTLAAGVGMSQPDQDAWFEAAFIALAGIPIGLLRRGVKAAMLKADHPSKIIPIIGAEIEDSWKWRRDTRQMRPLPRPEPETERCTPEQARAILQEYGLASSFASNR